MKPCQSAFILIVLALQQPCLGTLCPASAVTEEDAVVEASTFQLLQTRRSLSQVKTYPPPNSSLIFPGYAGEDFIPKRLSMEEANLTCSDVSFYGAATPKMQESFVTSIAALKSTHGTKTHRYSFQGSLYSLNQYGVPSSQTAHHRWVIKFAKENFADTDYLKATDPPADYTPLGPYDKSDGTGYRPKDLPMEERELPLDTEYYLSMIQSTFTLCPGGDRAWSMRFYEAIAAGSIPVIHSVRADFGNTDGAFWLNEIGYTYFLDSEVVNMTKSPEELESIADENYKLFLKYQTWMYGDQVPVAYNAYRKPCVSYDICRTGCLFV